MAFLVLIADDERGQRFDIVADITRMGRRDGNEIKLDFGSISGTHAELLKSADGFELRDLGSTNGTFLNGERVQAARVHRHDVIGLGEVQLLLDGDDVPTGAEALPLERSTIVIQPLSTAAQRGAPPAAFQTARRLRGVWPVLLGLIIAAVVAAFVVFLRRLV